jgi:hypothetical protein
MSTVDQPRNEFVFRKHDNIGAAAAEEDGAFLADCFFDSGDLDALLDCSNSKRIIVGRTGAGKSALMATIASMRQNVIQLSPHTLSLNYIANNQVIRFFEEAGVNLNPFYILLWKHIVVVELLRAKYHITSEATHRTTMSRLRDILYKKDHIKEQAVEYLETWGNRFWLTTDERMKELTEKVEKSLTGTLKGSKWGLELNGEAGRTLTTEERTEVVERGKRAVNAVQIRELENIIQILHDEIFSDPQERYFLTVDTLDEEWTEDRLKYRLIKALLDTIRSFRRVENVKIVAALRHDLLENVLHSTTDPGFQEEKYESMYLFLKWKKPDLVEMLGKRVNHLIRRRYTIQPIALSDILPNQIDDKTGAEYMLDRTFLRPRDLIQFFNDCIIRAEGRPRLTGAIIKQAEEEYSRKRLQSLVYEWRIIYPNLKPIIHMFYGIHASFALSDITKEFLDEKYTGVAGDIDRNAADPNVDLLNALYTEQGNFGSIRNNCIRNLHTVGVLGIKPGPTASVDWATEFRSTLSAGEVRPGAIIYIHPMFYRALGTRL